MKKRWYAICAAVLLIITAVIVGWLNVNRHYDNNNPLCHIPSSAALVMKINGVGAYKQSIATAEYNNCYSNLFFADLVTTAINNAIDAIDSVARNGLIDNRTIYISYHAQPTDTIGKTLLVFALENYLDGAGIMEAIEQSEQVKTTMMTLDGHDVMYVDLNPDHFYITTDSECLFATDDIELLRTVLSNSKPVLADDQCFGTLERTTSASVPISLFVNVASMDSLSIFDPITRTMSEWGDWLELDIDIHPQIISANGFLTSGKSTIYTVFAQHRPSVFGIDNMIPSSAQIFYSFGASKRGTSDELYIKQLQADGKWNEYQNQCTKLKTKLNIDIEAELSKVFEGEMAIFSFDESVESKQTCLVVSEKNGTISQGQLNSIISALRNVPTPRESDVISPIPSLSIPIYEAFPDSAYLFFLEDQFKHIPHRYYLRYENTLIFADTLSVLKQTLTERLQNRTYANDANFRAFRNNFSSECVSFCYCSSKAMRYITAKIDSTATTDYLNAVSDFYGFGLQLSNLSDLPYITASVLYEPNRSNALPSAWQCQIDTTIVGQPWPVINHNTKETEYLVQDANNNIHLINPSGLVLWSRKMNGRILGNVTQIDYYCNGKLQYLFATPESVHLIDRNGNDTAHFPIHLKHTATGGVTYLDYGNPSEFRLFVPCDNKQTMLFDKNCKPVEGWEMKHTEGKVSKPIDHWVTNGKDYLIHTDDYKTYITDRRGNERVPIKPLATNKNSRTYLVRANTPQSAFVASTANGELATIDINTATISYTHIDSIGDTADHTMLKLSDDDTLIFVDNGHIIFTDDFGKVKSIRVLKLTSADAINLVCDNMIAIWDKSDQLAYLFNQNGDLVDGFPTPAKGKFAITRQGNTLHLVVADGNVLTDYLK